MSYPIKTFTEVFYLLYTPFFWGEIRTIVEEDNKIIIPI